jgi:hypothetical protein
MTALDRVLDALTTAGMHPKKNGKGLQIVLPSPRNRLGPQDPFAVY